MIELGRKGLGRAEIAADLDVARQTVSDWEKAHPAFLDAMTRANDLSLAWWMKQGRDGIWTKPQGRSLNAAAYGLQVRNRFKGELDAPDATFAVNLDETRAALASKFDRLAGAGAPSGVPGKPRG